MTHCFESHEKRNAEVKPSLDPYAPWSLHFDHDGTEDVAVIRDANGEDLATSRQFWLPDRDDPVPPTLTAMRLMAAAPELLAACKLALSAMEAALEAAGHRARTRLGWEPEPLGIIRAAIAAAEWGGAQRTPGGEFAGRCE